MMAIEQHEVAVVWRLCGPFVAAMIVVVGDDDHQPTSSSLCAAFVDRKEDVKFSGGGGVGGRGKVPATGMQENARDESARDVDFPF